MIFFIHTTVGSAVVVQSLEISWHLPCNRDSIEIRYRWQIDVHKMRKKIFQKFLNIPLSIHDIEMAFPERWAQRWSLSTQTKSYKNFQRIFAQILDFNRIPIVFLGITWFSQARTNNFCEISFVWINFFSEPSVLGMSFLYHKWKVVLPICFIDFMLTISGHRFVRKIYSLLNLCYKKSVN